MPSPLVWTLDLAVALSQRVRLGLTQQPCRPSAAKIVLNVYDSYRVLQHPRADRVFDRIADARWFLAVNWCDHCLTPAGILNHEGQLSFQNDIALAIGEVAFLPLEHRKAVFNCCLTLGPGETTVYAIPLAGDRISHRLEILGLEIDPRYGKVAVVRVFEGETAL